MTFALRKAETIDSPALAACHKASWWETYRGLLRDDELSMFDLDRLADEWARAMAEGDDERIVVVAQDATGEVLGFGAVRLATDPDLKAEAVVEALHVAKRHQLRGVGRRIAITMTSLAGARGARTAGLWVPRDNLAAILFCQTLGGEPRGRQTRIVAGGRLPCIGLVWTVPARADARDDNDDVVVPNRERLQAGETGWRAAA